MTGKLLTNQTKMNIKYTLPGICSSAKSVIADNAASKLIMSVFGFLFLEFQVELLIVGIVFFFDLFTGLIASIKNNEFKSAKFFQGCTKLMVYCVFIMLAVCTDIVVSEHILNTKENFNVFLSMTFSFIILTDVFSVFENIEKLGYETPKNSFKKILKNLIKK